MKNDTRKIIAKELLDMLTGRNQLPHGQCECQDDHESETGECEGPALFQYTDGNKDKVCSRCVNLDREPKILVEGDSPVTPFIRWDPDFMKAMQMASEAILEGIDTEGMDFGSVMGSISKCQKCPAKDMCPDSTERKESSDEDDEDAWADFDGEYYFGGDVN
jgi:hypothetical protein